ncbi:MAG: putative phosphatidylethanolamine transferase Mcr [Pseudomonadota bacterium]|jgi:lipid A ethanolaminephosphotransferase
MRFPVLPRSPSGVGISWLIAFTALNFTVLYNQAFFSNAWQVYGASTKDWPFLLSLGVLLFAATLLVLSLLGIRFLTKPVLILVTLLAAAASHYMRQYNIVIDPTMVTNVLETDSREITDLLSPQLLLRFCVFGLLPAWLLWRTRVTCTTFAREVRNRLGLIAFALLLAVGAIAPFSAQYAGFFREHKLLRYYANPANVVYALVASLQDFLTPAAYAKPQALDTGAHIPASDLDRELIIVVVGETSRADHWSLNGYGRETMPRLSAESVITLPDFWSCGTATAWSVPCLFSNLGHDRFEPEDALSTENVLDVLQHAGISVLWRDNNSDSKGVATRVPYEDFRSPEHNPTCDVECRDVGMLAGLDDWIAAHPEGDLTIVLHQMGNHGPAYFKRYPAEFARFQPECRSTELASCSRQEIINSYDNALLYTDFFLAETIRFLKSHDDRFETALLYVSDHGESLGENGLYLHGLPYALAPEAQKHVAGLLWFGDGYRIDRQRVVDNTRGRTSHDDVFHTVLGLMEVQTPEYDPARDWLRDAHHSP